MELKQFIARSKKRTPVRIYLKEKIDELEEDIFTYTYIGEWEKIQKLLEKKKMSDYVIECDRRNSAIPLLDIKNLQARIEPGALIREGVVIEKNSVIMMGAILNINCHIGEESMIDMGAVIGAQAIIGKRCHIGANAVIAGTIEPPGNCVTIQDEVMIGANATILEGVTIYRGAIVGAGSVVTKDVFENEVVVGVPARVIKIKDKQTSLKVEIIKELREISQ